MLGSGFGCGFGRWLLSKAAFAEEPLQRAASVHARHRCMLDIFACTTDVACNHLQAMHATLCVHQKTSKQSEED
jgi:hypothetical protein